ncbi:flagellar basal body L-ring protein [Legionella quinlivanii]|uniref:Flagellar basal body L-ring protein n=1 Tax=Legionella quinlivanii TaxID=45073 RepID=A0A0W0XL72_9GAMM|nr:flagellar basal body L-ring protein FlgH [Legionella quinlivanii]KTD45367.1 flagellar basal body L-ring protein [Legionella quinlivanii]SEG14844.1 flagellar L-ring protein precursor FlgH [Legionella quinlivanii DSM 21216]STY10377.1 flagellar L-ring protein FlgH [Legionella quinlivanii]
MIKPILLIISLVILAHNPSAKAANLYNDIYYRPLIADRRASLPDDLLTVIVLETSNAQTSADLGSSKEIKTALEASYNQKRYDLRLGLTGKGNSKAQTGRNGKIKASLTVRIKAICPNGSYEVEGYQLIQINGEQQRILLSGIVRPEDISPQNTVLSTRIANAQITYTGDGSVSNSQRYNTIYKIMSFMGLV